MNEAKKKQIEWFLTFIDADFKKQHKGEIFTLLHDMKSYFVESIHGDLDRYLNILADPEISATELASESDRIVKLQERLRSFLESIVKRYHEAKQHEGEERDISELNAMLNQRILERLQLNAEARLIIRRKPEKTRDTVNRHQWKVAWPKGAIVNSPIALEVFFDDEDTGLMFMFMRTLEGILLDSIRQCDECKKWMIQTGKRERKFCSNLCRSRKNNRSYQAKIKNENGETYENELAAGARRARKSYVNKVKAKHSPGAKLKTSTKSRKHQP